MRLEQNEYIWAVSVESEDGHRVYHSYFTQRKDAERFASQLPISYGAIVVQCELWRDRATDRWYRITQHEVFVDREKLRAEAIAKLTAEERRALGV